MQIDDGWQRGITANSIHRDQGGVWEGFWASDEHFWQTHPSRLPQGLDPITSSCRAQQLQLGLWFAPDSAQEFVNWQRDVNAVCEFHRKHGVVAVKLDGIKATTKLAEQRLLQFINGVLQHTKGAVTFDLDITAETRPGYFGFLNCGPLFAQNRYTDWQTYWPSHSLRTLWELSAVIDPQRLRMEVLNPRRNSELYTDDPLAPHNYSIDHCFAMVSVACPLGWFECSGLHPDDAESLRNIVSVWKGKRANGLLDAWVGPIEACPGGDSWTDFIAESKDGNTAWLWLFREPLAKEDCHIQTNLPAADWGITQLAGTMSNLRCSDGMIQASAPNTAYGWWRFERIKRMVQ
jgi:alpha-galactosidase